MTIIYIGERLKILKLLTTITIVTFVGLGIWFTQLYFQMQDQLNNESTIPSTEIYSNTFKIQKGRLWVYKGYEKILASRGYKFVQNSKTKPLYLPKKSFSIFNIKDCPQKDESQSVKCIQIYHDQKKSDFVFLNEQSLILEIISFKKDEEPESISYVELAPIKFAQIYQNQPIKRTSVKLEDVPLYCLQAVTAIEDSRFLYHHGINIKSIFRATLKNLANLRFAQGGSTITQQLVKNFFLTPEKTIKRKLKEIFMATILEFQINKDRILELYLNVIYMGQNQTFQIRGFGEASKHYFLKDITQLNLAQCALMAAIINSPRRFNPFTNSEKALKRRNKILLKMKELEMIDSDSFQQANLSPLPKRLIILTDPSPYFVQAVKNELKKRNLQHKGFKVYTTLQPIAQSYAKESVINTLDQLERSYLSLKQKKESGANLQAAILSIDLKTGQALALVGGRNFKQTQYNRVTQAHRQVGSIMKPFVYLTALDSEDKNKELYSPLSILSDKKFVYKYNKQTWEPKNYKGTYEGPVMLYYALKNSINVATAQLGIQIGLDKIVDTSKKLGIQSLIQPLPAISLGAFELYLWEIAQAYSTIANFGVKKNIHFIKRITDLNDNEIYKYKEQSESVVNKDSAAILVSMMKQTTLSGTAQSLAPVFKHSIASKTGTTSNHRDSWFAGFTPEVLTIVWLGYDDNTHHGLSGATGALLIWKNFMKEYLKYYPVKDFKWPNSLKKISLSKEQLKKAMPQVEEDRLIPTEIYIRK